MIYDLFYCEKFTECTQILLVGFQIEAELVSFQTIACMGWVGWGASMHPGWPSAAPCSLGGPHWINDKEKLHYSLNCNEGRFRTRKFCHFHIIFHSIVQTNIK